MDRLGVGGAGQEVAAGGEGQAVDVGRPLKATPQLIQPIESNDLIEKTSPNVFLL